MSSERIFDNTEVAFLLKSDTELERAYFLFKMISIEPLVKIGSAVTNFALKANLPLEGLIKSTVFDYFCGGISENDCLPIIEKMYKHGVTSVLDHSVEGQEDESEFDFSMEKVLKILEFIKDKEEIPFAVFKPSGLGKISLYEKVGRREDLSALEQKEWDNVCRRYNTICEKAKQYDIAILIDAEQSWLQDAADMLATDMMRKYNTEKAIVFNTVQMYRHDKLEFILKQYEEAISQGYYLGYKLVRGAYMEKERERAKKNHYQSPICDSKLATNKNFNAGMEFILKNIDTISLFAGTHNEESSYLLMRLMEENQLENNDKRIWFGQLYGMSDHISFNLAKKGYNVAKYLPFGPVKDVVPYLVRRAEENTSVAGQTNRELNLIKKEKMRRSLHVSD